MTLYPLNNLPNKKVLFGKSIKQLLLLSIPIDILYGIIAILLIILIPNINYLLLLLPFGIVVGGGIIYFLFLQLLKNPENGLPIIAFVLPFERIGAITTSSFNLRLSQVFVVLTFFAYLLFTYMKDTQHRIGGIQIKKDYPSFFLLIFSLVNIASLAIAVNRARSEQVLVFVLFTFFTYLFVSNILKSKSTFEKVIMSLMMISIIISIYGIFQFFAGMLNLPDSITGLRVGYDKSVFGFPRVQATESEPQFWGNFLLTPVSISAAILFATLRKGKNIKLDNIRVIAITTFILGLINILLTYSRGAWYAMIVSLFIILCFYIRRFLNAKVIIGFFSALILIIGGFFLILNLSHSPLTLSAFTDRATQLQDNDRTLTANAALHFYEQHPLLGIGIGSFGPYTAPTYYQIPYVYGFDYGWRIVNNEYLEILTETGIIGAVTAFIFLLSLIISVVFALRKKVDPYTRTVFIGLIAGSIGLLVQYSAFSTLYIMQVWFIFAITAACAFNINHRIWTDNENE